MRRAQRHLHRISALLFALTTLSCFGEPAIAINDPVLFPPELYPDLGRHATEDVMLAGLASLYPGRIVRTLPATPEKPATPARAAMSARLANGIHYIRCYANGAEPTTPPAPVAGLIIDLRYFSTGIDDILACTTLCEKLIGVAPQINPLGDYPLPTTGQKTGSDTTTDARSIPIVVLVNHGTAGPIEAMLADLQARNKIILVGTATAGATARYQPLGQRATGWWRIVGEIQPGAAAQSLVGIGVSPRIRVAVQPENDLLAWRWIELGASPDTVLRLSQQNGTAKDSADPAHNNGIISQDPVNGTDLLFRRGYDILVALQVMGAIPPSSK